MIPTSLFDRFERTEVRARRRNESSFSYLNTSARQPIGTIRAILDSWYAGIQELNKSDLRSRFRSRDDETHLSAMFEIYIYSLIASIGLRASEPPPLFTKNGTRPDFVVFEAQDKNKPLFVIECTSVCCSKEERSKNRRFADLLNSLNHTRTEHFDLEISHYGTLEKPAPVAKIRKEIEGWIANLHPHSVMEIKRGGLGEMPPYTWQSETFTMIVRPIPRASDSRKRAERTVGILSEGAMSEVKISDGIKRALKAKSRYYGDLNIPFVLAVNVVDETFGRDEHCLDALFGEECVRGIRTVDGSVLHHPDRKTNGAWRGPGGCRMKNVSGLILTFGLNPFAIHKTEPVLYHHPSSHFPLLSDLWPLNQYRLSQGRYVRCSGRSAAQVLGLPPLPADSKKQGA